MFEKLVTVASVEFAKPVELITTPDEPTPIESEVVEKAVEEILEVLKPATDAQREWESKKEGFLSQFGITEDQLTDDIRAIMIATIGEQPN